MQLVDAHVAGDLRRHDHGMVADPGTAQPGPRIVRPGPVAGGDPVGPGLEHGKIQLVGAVVVRVGHRIGLEISPGVGRRGQVAIRRKNAILDPVMVEVIIRPVAVVQVGEDLDLRGDPGVHPHRQGGESRVVVLVEVKVGLRIVAIRSVHRKDRAGRGHGKGKRIGLRRGLDGSHGVARVDKSACPVAEVGDEIVFHGGTDGGRHSEGGLPELVETLTGADIGVRRKGWRVDRLPSAAIDPINKIPPRLVGPIPLPDTLVKGHALTGTRGGRIAHRPGDALLRRRREVPDIGRLGGGRQGQQGQ